MSNYSILQMFYASSKWRTFRMNLILERSKYNGGCICERCGKLIVNPKHIHAHHKKELTPDNVNDYSISFNPELIEIICHSCHDKEHYRFGYNPPKKVYLVYGPPMSGKTTFVLENMRRGDMVVDMDKLYQAISLQEPYNKPNNLLTNVLNIRTLLLDNIKTRYGKWYNAWIIGGYADQFKRERLAQELGAELIYIESTKEECYSRLETDKYRQNMITDWKKYIDEWFERYY